MDIEIENLITQAKKRNLLPRLLFFVLGVFILALNYNIFVLPNNFNVGGTSGLALIFKEILGLKPSTFILICSLILLLLSYLTLGKEQTIRSTIGALLYPILITITEPLAYHLIPYLTFSNILVTVIICGLLIGLANGLIYKTGFTTGGGDIIMQIISRYQHITEGNAQRLINCVIVLLSGFIFGIENIIYSALVILIATALVDKILIGISDSKMFFIYSKQAPKIKKYVLKELKTGITIFDTKGGYKKESRQMLMVVVPNKDYFIFKETILTIDPDCFFIINDCYEVSGGMKRPKYPISF